MTEPTLHRPVLLELLAAALAQVLQEETEHGK
jgi:hypothetical protein